MCAVALVMALSVPSAHAIETARRHTSLSDATPSITDEKEECEEPDAVLVSTLSG